MAKTALKILSEDQLSNGGAETISASEPYAVAVTIQGTSDLIFHAWNNESVAEKGAAAKGSKAKKSDNVESYVYRNTEGHICLPGTYLRGAIVHAAKFRQDPRSPRKSAMDLYKAGVVAMTDLAPLVGPKSDWDYLHKARVLVQRNAITRSRPAFRLGWEATIELAILLPEYIPPSDLQDVITNAGKLIGVGDFRPTYGRFSTTGFKIVL